jgi:hypothetical protein
MIYDLSVNSIDFYICFKYSIYNYFKNLKSLIIIR